VKRRQYKQEQKKLEEKNQLRIERQQVNAKSMKMSAGRKPEEGTNYGEFLYSEGLERRDIKAEQARLIKHNEQCDEDREATFTPQISRNSQRLRRDMPVVERLFMLDQVKAEKIDTLKLQREAEERKVGTFTPALNPNSLLKEGARTELAKSHLETHSKKEFQRRAMQHRLDLEYGVTHKPTLCDRSRYLAEKASNRASSGHDSNIFERLFKEAEEREMKYQVKRIEAHLLSLDLASTTVKGLNGRGEGGKGQGRHSDPESQGNDSSGDRDRSKDSDRPYGVPLWSALHAEAEKAKARKMDLQKRVNLRAREERRGHKMNLKSQDLSQKRLRKECRSILLELGFLCNSPNDLPGDEGGQLVTFPEFVSALERLILSPGYAEIAAAMRDQSEEMKGAIFSTVWNEITPLKPVDDSQDEQEDDESGYENGDRLVDMVRRG
jgi:hypothetical protein